MKRHTHRYVIACATLYVAASLIAPLGIGRAYAETVPETRAQFLHRVITEYFMPRMKAFADVAPQLVTSLTALCAAPGAANLSAARKAWQETLLVWEATSAIGFGPLLARRSVYHIDYWPVRENIISRTLDNPPTTTKGLELIGGPAKGIPTIEWLLWTPVDNPALLSDPKRCAYAVLLARDVAEEAQALQTDFAALAATDLPEQSANDAFAGLINMANGGMDDLGVKKMETPAKIGNGKHFPRLISATTLTAWEAQWSSLRSFLVGSNKEPSSDNLAAFLRSHDSGTVADKLQEAVDRVNHDFESTKEATPAAALILGKDVGTVRTVLAEDVASSLNIAIQFGDDDGD